jgi:hypothetical protein
MSNDIFLKVPYILWVWDFVGMYLTHIGTRIWGLWIHIYFRKWFFWLPKHCCTLWAHGIKLLFFNFEGYNIENGKEWVCKIWWTCRNISKLEDLTIRGTIEVPNFAQFALFSRGLLWGGFGLNVGAGV